MSSKLLLTLQGVVPPYFSFQHTHLVTLWFTISWWYLFISTMWHQRTPASLTEFSSVGLPASPGCLWSLWWPASHFPLCLGRLSECPLLGDPSPALWPPGLSSVAACLGCLSQPALSQALSTESSCPTVSCSLSFDQSLAEFHKWYSRGRTALLSYVISSTDFRARWPAF